MIAITFEGSLKCDRSLREVEVQSLFGEFGMRSLLGEFKVRSLV
jgi:hypothetical protein